MTRVRVKGADGLGVGLGCGLGGRRVRGLGGGLRGGHGGAGFSLVELLVVIGVIALLAAISVIGFKAVGDKTKGTTGRVTFENLRTLTAEAESAGLFKRQPGGFWVDSVWQDIATKPASTTTGRKYDFWRAPDADSSVVTLHSPDSRVVKGVSGLLTEDAGLEQDSGPPPAWANGKPVWYGSDLVANTAIAFAMMRSVPIVATSLDGMSSSQNKTAVWYDSAKAYRAGNRVILTLGTGPSQGRRVYVARRDVAAGIPLPASGDDTNWERSFGAVLDPFNNPIVFVPANGMHIGKLYEAARTYGPGERVYTLSGTVRRYSECVAQTKGNAPTFGTPTAFWRDASPIRSPDGKVFWASAGADGDLDTPGDNAYSFEN